MEKSILQLKLYPLETRFIIKMVNFESGNIKVLRDISIDEYEKSLKYCKYLNAQNYNVFLSPLYLRGAWILLDDVSKTDIERLHRDGFEPYYNLETSPSNYQAILKISDSPLDKAILTFISKQLAETYGADKNSADPGHFFRLAGFTNRKQKYCKNGLFPFVKLYLGTGKSCTAGQNYINRISAGISQGLIELPERHIPTAPLETGERLTSGCAEYVRKVYASGSKDDVSRLDFKAALYAAKKGFSETDIIAAIKLFSPDLESRKKRHIDDYVARTVKNALYR